MRRVSVKRARQLREYTALRREFLDARPVCEFPGEFSEGCTRQAVDVHHMRGRVGADLLDQNHWLAICREHHDLITREPALALRIGVSELRIGGRS